MAEAAFSNVVEDSKTTAERGETSKQLDTKKQEEEGDGGSESEYETESESSSDEEERVEVGKEIHLSTREQNILQLSYQNCFYHVVELTQIRNAELTVMLNYVQHMQALLMNVALLALPTAASFAISYCMDNFISKRDVKLYKNYLLIVINAVLWLYGLPMLLLSIRRFNHSCTCVEKLAKSWAPIQTRIENTSTREEPVPACCDNEQKAAVGAAADNVEDMTSSAADLETEETQTTVRRREVVLKSEMRNPPPDVSGAGDVGLVDAARPTAAVEPTVKDKHE